MKRSDVIRALKGPLHRLAFGCVLAAGAAAVPGSTWAQVAPDPEAESAPNVDFEARPGPEGRHGFTFETTLGGGFQYRTLDDSVHGGLFGLTFGIGGFVTQDFAVLGRVMNAVVFEANDFRTVVGVGGPAVQYWLVDVIRLELGFGVGWGRRVGVDDFADDVGFGIMSGVGVAVWQNPRHAITVGAEYAPVFLEGVTIHASGLVVGYQFL